MMAVPTTIAQQTVYKFPIQYIDWEGQRIAYVDQGDQEGPTLLLVHGLGGYIKHWYTLIDSLQDDFRVVAMDLPGYGASTLQQMPSEDPMSYFAQAVDALCNKLQLQNVTLVGHSMGGQVAIVSALDNPDWLGRLVLLAPAGLETFTTEEAQQIRAITTAEAFRNQTEEQIRYAFRINFAREHEWVEEFIQDRLDAREATDFDAYCKVREQAVEGMLSHPVIDELSEIKAPTTVMFGEMDLLIPNRVLHPTLTPKSVANVAKKITAAEVIMVPNAGHMIQVDQPGLVTKITGGKARNNEQISNL